jgi:hypothetical protein
MKSPIRKSGYYSSRIIRIAWLLSGGLSCVLLALPESAAAFQVDLSGTLLPIQEFAVSTFDSQALTALSVEFAGYPGEWNYLGGSITAFSVTKLPEPSATLLTVMGLADLSWVFSKRR